MYAKFGVPELATVSRLAWVKKSSSRFLWVFQKVISNFVEPWDVFPVFSSPNVIQRFVGDFQMVLRLAGYLDHG